MRGANGAQILNNSESQDRRLAMRKIIIALAAFATLGLAACNRGETTTPEEPAAATQAAAAPTEPEPTPPEPAPLRPAPTLIQIDACADQALVENNLTATQSRRIRVGQVLKINGRDTTVADGDMIWSMCRTALTDPISERMRTAQAEAAELTAQQAEIDREITAAQAVITAKTAERNRVVAAITAANERAAAIQGELNARAEAERAAAAAAAQQARPAAQTAPERPRTQ